VSNVSFTVGKADSPSMIGSNLRIIKKGKITSQGRLEIKFQDTWHTVQKAIGENKENLNLNIIISACKNLGYLTGVQELNSTQLALNKKVPQLTAECPQAAASFPCYIKVMPPNTEIKHDTDLYLNCLDKDPNAEKGDGTYGLAEGVFGDKGQGK